MVKFNLPSREGMRWAIRKISAWIVVTVIVAILVAALSEWFIKFLEEQGFYAEPTQRARRAMSAILVALASPWIVGPLSCLAGLAAGVWLDYFLRRDPSSLPEQDGRPIDRDALANEAEELAQQISALLGEYSGRSHLAWYEDIERAQVARERNSGMRTRQADVWVIERYGERFHARVWRLIYLARKCISIHQGDLWDIEHGINPHDIVAVTRFLAKLAVQLRQPQPNIPLHDGYRGAIPIAPPSPQPPPDVQEKKQP